MRILPGLILVLVGAAAPAAAQDAVQLGRLAADQRVVAEQVRRLQRLLETLEARDRQDGRVARADLLAQAAARLHGVETEGALAAVIEGIAGDLSAMRTGAALDAQEETIRVMEQLLDLLLETQNTAEQQQRQADLQAQLQKLEDLRRQQEELRRQNEALLRQLQQAQIDAEAQSGNANAPSPQREPSAREKALRKELERLAREQRQLAEEIAEAGRGNGNPSAASAAEHARQAAEMLDEAAQTPATKEAQSGQPQSGQPQSGQPQSGQPQSGQPQSGQPQSGQPQSGQPQSGQPQSGQPQSGQPQSGQPQSGQPQSGQPQSGQPQSGQPQSGQPQSGQPQSGQPQSGQPQSGQPQSGQPQSGQPQSGQPQQDPAASQQQNAAEEQRQAEEALQRAVDQAKEDLKKLENRKRLQALEDVRALSEQILAAHKIEQDALRAMLAADGEPLTRAQRARLRQAARAEEDLAGATQSLLVKIETLGASTFPFFLHALEVDHRRLAADIGPPRLAVSARSGDLAQDLTANWESLIEAIRLEQERVRRQLDGQQQGGGQQAPQDETQDEQPLVDFAMELQLLKRLQTSLGRDLSWMRQKLESYARAGISAGTEEDLELQRLLERQIELRRQFEDMLARLQGTADDPVRKDL